jgi:Histidine kinase
MLTKPILKVIIALAWLACVGLHAFGQDHLFEHFGKADGLRSKNQYYCFQDSKLRLWFASEHGVAWYDGEEFHNIGQEANMPDMDVFKIIEDRQGDLWFHTLNGVPVRYDGKTVTRTWSEPLMQALKGANYITCIVPLKSGGIVFGTNDGRAGMIMENGEGKLLFPGNYSYKGVQIIDPRPDGSIEFHFSYCNGIGIWKNNQFKMRCVKPFFDLWQFGPLRTATIGPNRYVYGVENRIGIIAHEDDSLRGLRQVFIPQKNILFVGTDNRQDLWIGTNEGALQFLASDTLLQHPNLFLKGHTISSVCRDHEGGLWFTSADGIFHCKDENILTSTIPRWVEKEEGSAIFASRNGSIYLGYTDGKIEEINRHTLQTQHVFPSQDSILSPQIHRFFDGPHGEIIVVGNSGFKVIRDGKLVSLSHYKIGDMDVRGEDAIACLYANWVHFKIDPAGKWLDQVKGEIIAAHSNVSSRCLHCAYDAQGQGWFATNDAVIRVRGAQIDTIQKQYLGNYGYKNSSLAATPTGQYLFGSANDGLLVFGKGWSTRLSTHNGLLDNHISKTFNDPRGNTWIITADGISTAIINDSGAHITTSKRLVDLFGTNNVNDLIVDNDTIWAAAEGGLIAFPSRLMDKHVAATQVAIMEISANGVAQPCDKPLVLKYDQNNIRIRFGATAFVDPKTIEYRYRITENDTNYQISPSEYLELPQLGPGQYHIEIQARQPTGDWSLTSAKIAIEITPPYWKTWWFFTIMGLLVLLTAAIIVRAILADGRRKSELRESLAVARHNALINQMNPHFVFNSLNSIQNFILNHETKSANSYLADFAACMRSILVSGRSSSITLSEEVKFLNLYLGLEALRLDHKFDFEVIVSKGLIASTTRIPTMMLQPLLENSIWHGIAPLADRHGKVSTLFSITDQYLTCTIEDNGIGRKIAAARAEKFGKEHQSIASSIMEERVALMNESLTEKIKLEIQDLVDLDGQGIGTRVTLLIPLNFATKKENDQSNHRR